MWEYLNLLIIYSFFASSFIITGLFFLILDTKTKFIRYRYKDQDRDHLIKIYKDIYPLVGFNLFVIQPLLTFGSYNLIEVRTDPFDLTEGFLMILSLLSSIICYDVLFWIIHKILHLGCFYDLIHYKHHELRTTVGIGGIYVHPIEYMFSNFLPAFIGVYLFRHHVYSICLLLAMSGGGAVVTHSGYLGTHIFHHWYRHCYYGVFGIMDRLMNSEGAEKHHNKWIYKYMMLFLIIITTTPLYFLANH